MVLDSDLVRAIRDTVYEGRQNDRLERPATLRKLAKAKGWFVAEERCQLKEWGTRGTHSRVLSNCAEMARRPAAELLAEGVRPVDVSAYLGM